MARPGPTIEAAAGHHERAIRLLAAGQALSESIESPGPRPSMGDPSEAVREAIGDEATDRVLAEGRAMSREESRGLRPITGDLSAQVPAVSGPLARLVQPPPRARAVAGSVEEEENDVDERGRHQLHRKLEEAIGREEADILMAHLPPATYGDLATKDDLARLADQLRAEIERMGRRLIMWTSSMVLAAVGLAFAAGRFI